jgi:hypothetical protein
MRLPTVALLSALLFVVGCKESASTGEPVTGEPGMAEPEEEPASAPVHTAQAPVETPAAAGHVHNVACGCSLGQTCGNMIEVDGKYVPLEGDLGLGKMEFCGKKGLQAEVQGELKDGKFLATSYKLVEAE